MKDTVNSLKQLRKLQEDNNQPHQQPQQQQQPAQQNNQDASQRLINIISKQLGEIIPKALDQVGLGQNTGGNNG